MIVNVLGKPLQVRQRTITGVGGEREEVLFLVQKDVLEDWGREIANDARELGMSQPVGSRVDQGSPEMTAREHLVAAWDKAYPVPAGHAVPAGVAYIRRRSYPLGFSVGTGTGSFAASQNIRTLDPLPPVIPDDCMAVWASTRKDESRRVWVRATGSMAGLPDKWGVWDDGNRDADYALTRELIDPKPVPKEES